MGSKRERTVLQKYYKDICIKIFLFIYILFLASQISFAQKESYPFEFFSVNIEGPKLSVITSQRNLIYQKDFSHPAGYTSDLDEDGIDELVIIDSVLSNNKTNFWLFIFNTLDSFFLVDSLNSGSFLPYETTSEETAGIILVSGNSFFEEFNEGVTEYFLPINCWKYQDASLSIINNEIYDIFISENEFLVDYIDKFYLENGKDCSTSLKIKSAIASAYVNFFNGGEESVASHFLKNYYLCKDFEEFGNHITKLLDKGSE